MRRLKLVLLFAFRTLGMFQLTRWLTRDRLKILCYHGFEFKDEAAFRPKLFMRPGVFEKRLSTIKRYGLTVLPLEEAIERLYAGTLPPNTLVITVDDGFHGFHRVAVPHLQRYGYPATVYVTTYYVQHGDPIFRLVVQYMFWKTPKHELAIRGVPWTGDGIVDLADPGQAERVMWDYIKYGEGIGDEGQRRTLCEQLGTMLDVSYDQIVQSKILHLMSPDELRSLSSANISVELHTHRHSFSKEDRGAAEREIADNRAALRQWLAEENHHFCYPSGEWHERQWGWLDSMRVKSSATCLPGLNDRNTPRHALRRFLDGENIHQLEFEAALAGFSDLIRDARRGT